MSELDNDLFKHMDKKIALRALFGMPDDSDDPEGDVWSDLEQAVGDYNTRNGTHFDLKESIQAYLALYK